MTHKFDHCKSNSSYMFRLHKTSIRRPFVSEHLERKLYCCSGIYKYKIYIFWYKRPDDDSFVQPKHVAAVGFAIIKLCLILITPCFTSTNAMSRFKFIFSVLKMFFQIKYTIKTGATSPSEPSAPMYKTARCHIMLYHVTNSYDDMGHTAYSCNTGSSIESLTQTYGKFKLLYLIYIQGVPGGMWNTSGECSLC